MKIAPAIELTERERETLKALSRGKKISVRLSERSAIVLLAAQGLENIAIATRLKMTRQKVARWRDRYANQGLKGIEMDAPRSGRIPEISAVRKAQVIQKTLREKPVAATQWSRSTMATLCGMSDSSIGRIWKAHGLKPHLSRTFKLSNDKHLAEKLAAIVGLYLNPPEHALVFSCAEKSQIDVASAPPLRGSLRLSVSLRSAQALDRTQPGLPLKKGRCGTHTHDYVRHGTTTLFAALEVLEGRVIGQCLPRHRHQEFLKFLRTLDASYPKTLKLHLILDNYGTHKHAKVQRWLDKHPRFKLHFTPTSASWTNLVERWFRELSEKAIRRAAFKSVSDLEATIETFLSAHNATAKPFVWTASVNTILTKLNKVKAIYDTLH